MQTTLTAAWQEIADFDCAFQLSTSGNAEITLSATTPLSTDSGLIIDSLAHNRFEFLNSLKLWARSNSESAVLTVVGV